jgi:glycosyltransferase involved in cell wall biosynthesis
VTVLSFADTRFPIERANGVQTMATCHALAVRGHDVRLVVRADSAPVARDPFAFYDLPPVARLAIDRRPSSGGPRGRRGRFLVDAVRITASARQAIVYTRDLGLASLLLQLPRWRRPRVVYESHGLAAVVAGELPRLLGSAGPKPSRAKLLRLDRRDRHVWRRAHAYVTITRALADDLAARFGPRVGVFVVPDGARPASGAETGPEGEPGLAGYAGHLYPWKGVDIFIHALAHVPDLRGLIVGGHPGETDRARVEALVKTLGLERRVEITGLVPPAEVRTRLARASMLVLPNTASAISERYTSPLKLFEYLTLGRAIVASDLPSIREVLTDGATALLVPPGDPVALADALARLAGDGALAARLGRAAAVLAPDYTWARRAERLEAALEAAAA